MFPPLVILSDCVGASTSRTAVNPHIRAFLSPEGSNEQTQLILSAPWEKKRMPFYRNKNIILLNFVNVSNSNLLSNSLKEFICSSEPEYI
jgi:hypothetical protein